MAHKNRKNVGKSADNPTTAPRKLVTIGVVSATYKRI